MKCEVNFKTSSGYVPMKLASSASIVSMDGYRQSEVREKVVPTDTINDAIGKLEARITDITRQRHVLPAARWTGEAAPFNLELSVPGSKADGSNDIDVWFDSSIGTVEQTDAWCAAVIKGGAQGDGVITLIAQEVKPEVDIPVIVRVVG